MLSATHPKELPFEALVRLLEERKENSPCHTTKAHPKILPGALGLEEVEEHIDGGGCVKWLHSMENVLMKAQLLGCSWAGATLISVTNALSKPVRGRRNLIRLKTV